MAGTYDLRYDDLCTYCDLFEKLKFEEARYGDDPSAYNLFNAVVTAWSLADWILEDVVATSPAMESDLRSLTGRTTPVRRGDSGRDRQAMNLAMRVCADLANGGKHAKIARRTPPDVRSVTATDCPTVYGDTQREYMIEVNGVQHGAWSLLIAVVKLYEDFLAKHGLCDLAAP